MKIKTAKLTAIRKIEIFEEELTPLKQGDVLVRMKSVGICGSDMHYFKEGGLGSFKSPLPMYMGHEPAGIVVESKSKNFPVLLLILPLEKLRVKNTRSLRYLSGTLPVSDFSKINVSICTCKPKWPACENRS